MEGLRIAAVCLACLPVLLLVKKAAPEQALLLTAAVLAAAGLALMGLAAPAVERLRALFDQAGLDSGHTAILLKTLAVSIVTKLCADLCRDGGSQALGTAVELAGALTALLILLPLLEAVTALLQGYLT